MKKPDIANTVLAFYRSVYKLITAREFDAVVAEALVAAYQQAWDHISLDQCTVKSLRSCHREFKNWDTKLRRTTRMSEKAFADLSSQLHNPAARRICRRFQKISGTDENDVLYIQLRRLRLLGKNKSGPAEITFIVDSASQLINLVKRGRDARCQFTHFCVDLERETAR